MKRLPALSAVLFAVLLAAPLWAGEPAVKIDPASEWCHNDTGVQCAYASAETLCRHHALKAGYDLRQQYRGQCPSAGHLAAALESRGIRAKYQNQGNRDTAILKEACSSKYGAVIGVNGSHAICLVGFNEADGTVQTVGNMDAFRVYEWKMADFLRTWDGFTVVIVPGDKAAPVVTPRREAVPADLSMGHAVKDSRGRQIGWVDNKTGLYRAYDPKTDTFGSPQTRAMPQLAPPSLPPANCPS